MPEYVKPFVEDCLQFVLGLIELRHFQVNEGQLVVKNAIALILQLDAVTNFRLVFVFGENEIQDADQINRRKLIVPIATLRLFLNREAGVKNASISKIILFGALHLDDEAFAVLAGAKQIENRAAVESRAPDLFVASIRQLLNLMLRRQQLIEEVNQQVLVRLAAEQLLEAEIGEWVNVFFGDHGLGIIALRRCATQPFAKAPIEFFHLRWYFRQVNETNDLESDRAPAASRGYLLAAGSAALWGLSGVVTSYLLRQRQMRPDELLVFRTCFAALILFGWLGLKARHLVKVRRADLPYFALLGGIGLVVNQGAYYLALTEVSVGYALMLQYQAPVFLMAYGVLSKTERMTYGKLLAAALALSGCALMMLGQLGGLTRVSWLGTLGALTSGAAFAFYTVYGQRGLKRYDSRTMMAYAFLFSSLMWLLIRPPWKIVWGNYDASTWAFFFYLAAVATVLPFALYLASLRYLEASRVSLTSILEPVVAAAAAWLWLGQALRPLQIAGGVAVLCGVGLLQIETALFNKSDREKQQA